MVFFVFSHFRDFVMKDICLFRFIRVGSGHRDAKALLMVILRVFESLWHKLIDDLDVVPCQEGVHFAGKFFSHKCFEFPGGNR